MNETFVYEHGHSLYVNLTNSCTNSCDFCIRNQMDGIDGYDLWLKREPDTYDVIDALNKFKVEDYKEIVFCGYGEPTMRLEILLETAAYIKKEYPLLKTRINTNGQANLYHGEDITHKLEGLIDKLSISLNAPTASEYQSICHSVYKENALPGILEFARLAKRYVPSVRLTVVDVIGKEKIGQCQTLADENGIELYVRPAI